MYIHNNILYYDIVCFLQEICKSTGIRENENAKFVRIRYKFIARAAGRHLQNSNRTKLLDAGPS